MDRGPWWVTVRGVAKSGTRLSTHATTPHIIEREKAIDTDSSQLKKNKIEQII